VLLPNTDHRTVVEVRVADVTDKLVGRHEVLTQDERTVPELCGG
jgi:hypothetical protein